VANGSAGLTASGFSLKLDEAYFEATELKLEINNVSSKGFPGAGDRASDL
jgi:hypothetical protein